MQVGILGGLDVVLRSWRQQALGSSLKPWQSGRAKVISSGWRGCVVLEVY